MKSEIYSVRSRELFTIQIFSIFHHDGRLIASKHKFVFKKKWHTRWKSRAPLETYLSILHRKSRLMVLIDACALVMTTERNQFENTKETLRAIQALRSYVLFCLKALWICWNMQINLMKIQQKLLSRFSASHSSLK